MLSTVLNKLQYNFVETPRKFIVVSLLRAVSTKLYFYLIFTMQTYKELSNEQVVEPELACNQV